MSNKVLITGVAGFLGRYAARHFTEKGCSVIGVDSVPPENAPLSSLAVYYSQNLPDKALVDLLLKCAPDVCIHCAGLASVPLSVTNPAKDFYANTVLTFEILEGLRLHAPSCRFILLSSAAVYGNPQSLPVNELQPPAPISPYGFHKWQCEQLCQEYATVYGLPTASARIFSAYGPGLQRQVLWDITRKVLTQPEVRLQGTGQESRDFIHAQDIARGLEVIMQHAPMNGEAYNLASGRETKIIDLAQLIIEQLTTKPRIIFTGEMPSGTPKNWVADISILKAKGFLPGILLEDGVRDYVDWARREMRRD